MSRSFVAGHFPTSPVVRLVCLSFVSLSIPLHSPCFHFCPFHVPFSSPLFPFHFFLLSYHVDFLLPPLISLHFLAFPLPSFLHFRQHEAGNTHQQRAGRGIRVWDPCFCSPKTTFSGTWGTPPPPRPKPYVSDVGRGGWLLGIRHASAMSADILPIGYDDCCPHA